jgi:trypsin-like peptidase
MSAKAGAVMAALLLAAAARKPTNAALRKAFENNAHAVVEVAGPHRSGPGVVVGAGGQVLTSVDYVSLDEATVKLDGRSFRARVVVANADLKVAVVAAELPQGPPDAGDAPAFRPPAVRLDETFEAGTELVAITRDQGGALAPRLVEVSKGRKATSPFVEVNASLPNGTPLFDAQGRLVALAVQRLKSGARALPVPEVKGQLAQGAQP